MIKVLFIGDPHFKISNFEEVDLFIEKIVDLIKITPMDICLVAGDILHTHERVNSMVLNKALNFIGLISSIVKTYILVGNHDMYNNKQFLTDGHWMNCMKNWNNVVIVDKVVVDIINQCKIVFVPYVQNGMFGKALDTCGTEWVDACCIFAHQEFYGCKMGAIISEDGDKWDIEYPEVISGHIHDLQRPQSNVYYPGSSLQQSYSDNVKNIVVLLTIRPGEKNAMVEEIDLDMCKKRIVHIKCDEFLKYDFGELLNSKDKIKITLHGVVEEYKELRNTSVYRDISKRMIIIFKKTDNEKDYVIIDQKKDFRVFLEESISKEKNIYLEKVMKMCFA